MGRIAFALITGAVLGATMLVWRGDDLNWLTFLLAAATFGIPVLLLASQSSLLQAFGLRKKENN